MPRLIVRNFLHPRVRLAALLLAGVVALGAWSSAAAQPSPPSGSLSNGQTTVNWNGNVSGTSPDGPPTCTENVTCEVFELTLLPGDYTGKRIGIIISWLLASNDYDLYVHANDLNGNLLVSSTQFATTSEGGFININPGVVVSPLVYAVQTVAWAVAPGDPYVGVAFLEPAPPPRNPTYLAGNLNFSPNITTRAPVAGRDGEPSIRIDVDGNCYVGGIRGVPAGVDLWRFDLDPDSPTFDPGMQNPTYLGQPDAFLPQDPEDPTAGGADGGGDIDISVSFPTDGSTPVVTITSLAAANISSAYSFDRGETFTLSAATAIVPADDRQWNESTGHSTVYLYYRAPIPFTALFVQRSDDFGETYPVSGLVSPTNTTPGYIDVDHNSGTVYVSHQNDDALFVSRSTDGGANWATSTVDNTTGGHSRIFDPIKVDDAGNVYTTWSDGQRIWLAHSENGGVSWSNPVQVNDNSVYRTNLLPWLEAGSDGRVVVVWYGTTQTGPPPGYGNLDTADWEVLFTQTLNATDADPVFRQQVISDHIIHASNISLFGLGGAANRNLIDLFQVALDPQGAAVIAFTDDHNDFDGHTYVTRQLDGPSLYASANGNGQVNPVAVAPPLPPGSEDPEVVDFLHDSITALLQPIPEDHPADILAIDYECEEDQGQVMVRATMTVSLLDVVPAQGVWRANFAANAPGGVSDRGDGFYIRADSNDGVLHTFTWGTTMRNPDGSLSNTIRGYAHSGSFDTVAGTVTMQVSVDSLNMHASPPIANGSILHGLRGQTFLGGSSASGFDETRGGYYVTCFDATGIEEQESPGPLARFLSIPRPNPSGRAAAIDFVVARPGFVELAVFDVTGRRVRTLHAGPMAAGEYTRTWNGRTDRFSDASAGIYFFVLNTGQDVLSEKVTLLR